MIPMWLQEEVKAYRPKREITPRTILDLGANIGTFTLFAKRWWPECVVYAYEPLPSNCEDFKWHTFGKAGIRLTEAAVGACDCVAPLHTGDKGVLASFHKHDQHTGSVIVPVVAASSLPRCELVKIDTEGCEREIMENLDLSLTQYLVVEYHRAGDINKLTTIALRNNFELISHEPESPNIGLLHFSK